jgi:hypothetical protein
LDVSERQRPECGLRAVRVGREHVVRPVRSEDEALSAFELAIVRADECIVLLPEEGERTREGRFDRRVLLDVRAVELTHRYGARHRVGEVQAECARLLARLALEIVCPEIDARAACHAVLDVEEVACGVFGLPVPQRAEIRGAVEVEQSAVGRVRQAEHGARLAFLIGHADGGGRIRCQVVFKRAVAQRLARIPVIDERIAIVMDGDNPAAQRPVACQRTRHINLAAVGLPRARVQCAVHGELIERALAHQVDGAAGLARALEEAGRSAQHFDAFEYSSIERACGERADRSLLGHAIVLDRVDFVATRGELIDPVGVGNDRDPGGLLHDFGDRVQAAVFDQLARDDAHRLRDFSQ